MEDSNSFRSRRAPLPRWSVPLVAVIALIAGAAVLVVLWGWIDGLTFSDLEKKVSAQIEALKLAAGIVVGGGGLFALYLAARRQRTQELELEARRTELAQRDRVQIHAEQVAYDERHDAVERRVTESYAKAADQLGSDKAPVRLAGLYALERLGQGNPDHRQTVIDVICAYLRMPYTPPDEPPVDDAVQNARREELQVRLTAQRLLGTHLRAKSSVRGATDESEPDTYWQGARLDLRGAYLHDFFLGDCELDVLLLQDVRLAGETVLRGTRCGMGFFQSSIFEGHADFRGTVFTVCALFSYSTFQTDVWFHGDQHYSGARFDSELSFYSTNFRKSASFREAQFSGSVDFIDAHYEIGPKAIDLDGAFVKHPEAVSPAPESTPTNWPPGWRVEKQSGQHVLVHDNADRQDV